MNKKEFYPIKYALLEMKANGGEKNNWKEISLGYIVSKCYVIEKFIRYLGDGSTKSGYKVVFPYNNITQFIEQYKTADDINTIIESRNLPLYDSNYNLLNAQILYELYDNYNEIKSICEYKNSIIRANLITNIPIASDDWEIKLRLLQKDFDKKLLLCNKYEEWINMKTKNMHITPNDSKIYKLINDEQ